MFHKMAQEQEIALGRINISDISRQTKYDRKTIRKYLNAPRPTLEHPHSSRGSKLDPYKDYIKDRVVKYPLLSSIRLLTEIQSQGYTGKYTILKDYIRTIRPKTTPLAEIRYETDPGDQAQVDWSDCLYQTSDEKMKKVNCFSMVLGYSRMRYIEFTPSTDILTFLSCHQHAFEYFGGVTKEILYDNLKVVVLKRKYPSTSSEFNPLFADFRDHYGFTAYLCRPYRAKTKGKIERAIGYVKTNFLYGRTFASLEDLNVQGRQWMEIVNHQKHGTTFEIPYERLKTEGLKNISSTSPYALKRRMERKISNDGFVSLFGNLYSVPWNYARQMATVEIIGMRVLIEIDKEVVCEHTLIEGKNQISKQKEHFKGLHKAARDETNTRMPPTIPLKKALPKELEVEKRSLSEYDMM